MRKPSSINRLMWSLGVTAFVMSLLAWIVNLACGIGRSGSYPGYAFGWCLVDGGITLHWDRHPAFFPHPPELFFLDARGDLGFEMPYIDGDGTNVWHTRVPLWPVCGGLGVVCAWMWRRQRRRRGMGAFPVVTAAAMGEVAFPHTGDEVSSASD